MEFQHRQLRKPGRFATEIHGRISTLSELRYIYSTCGGVWKPNSAGGEMAGRDILIAIIFILKIPSRQLQMLRNSQHGVAVFTDTGHSSEHCASSRFQFTP